MLVLDPDQFARPRIGPCCPRLLETNMSPLELLVLIGIIIALTVFAVILAWVSRLDGKVSPAADAVPRQVTVDMNSADRYDRLGQTSSA
jgi:hypothetical protein